MLIAVSSAAEFVLTDDERGQLVAWSRGASSRLAVRARIVLACAEPGVVYERLAAELGVTAMTVGKWRRRFAADGLAGLADGERAGRPKAQLVLTGAERDQLVRWSRRGEGPPELGRGGRRPSWCLPAPSVISWCGGLGGRSPRRRWRCGPRSCWRAPAAGRTSRSLNS